MFARCQAPRFRPLVLAAVMLHAQSFLPWLLLLAMPVRTHTWSRPLWYQVGLDLQPWGCQPNSLEGCRGSLGCPGHWMGLGVNRIYPVAGVTVATTMMLMLSRAVMQRRRSQATKSEVSMALLCPHSLLLLFIPNELIILYPSSHSCLLGLLLPLPLPLPHHSHPSVPTSVHTQQSLAISHG